MSPFDASLESLRHKFVMGAQSRLRRIRDAVRKLEDDPADVESLHDVMRHFHALSGAAGTYGFPEVGAMAQDVEAECNEHINAGLAPSSVKIHRWREVVGGLRRQFGMVSSGIVARPMDKRPRDPALQHVLLLQTWSPQRDLLAKVLSAERMKVRVASDRATARRALREVTPDAFIIDLAVQGGTGVQVIDELRATERGASTSVLFINSAETPMEKVDAVRCGADVLMDANALPERVSDRLRALLARASARKTRILYIEPDADQVAFVQRLLGAAGHDVKVCQSPDDIDAALEVAAPDVILMEVVLPQLNGYELAALIRRDPRWAHVPVVFTTTSHHLPDDMESRRVSDDEFVVKPIEPRRLLLTINAQVERARLRAKVLERDGVTGLYNHSAFVRRLESWMKAGETNRRPSCLVVLDVCDMAEINARHGHHVGDQVLRELAALVTSNLSASQLVARYGSDELVALLYDMTDQDAERLLTNLRDEFAALKRFTPGGRSFQADFTAGITRMKPAWRRPQVWLAEVEQALALTKGAGAPVFVSTT